MADFVKLALTAKRLIDENGRTVSIRRVTDGAPADPSKPWKPGTAGAPSVTEVEGVFLDTERSYLTGELLKEDESIVLVAASGLEIVPSNKDKLVDGTTTWEVTNVKTLKPADVPLLYELRIKS